MEVLVTLAELELELVKRGIVVVSTVRRGGEWLMLVQAHDGMYGLGVDIDLDAAIRKSLGEYDGKRAATFCVGEA